MEAKLLEYRNGVNMAEIIKGTDVADSIKKNIKVRLTRLDNIKPCLAMLKVGNNPSDISYQKGIIRNLDELGIIYKVIELPLDIEQKSFEEELIKVNEDKTVTGILIFRPLPAKINRERINELINPQKDVDCMNPVNIAKLALGDKSGFYPCTPEAVIAILDYINVDYKGKNVVIIGHSQVVGRPLGYMLIARDATVTWCHIYTKDVISHCKNAEIIISAAGKAGLITREYVGEVSKDCIIIDVGINKRLDGKPGICGDVAFEEVEPLVGRITTVPGGVGSVTSTILAEHIVRAAENLYCSIIND